mmetsp:Transcript_18274/g.45704  ORF Transcript_18274/g.45704 Transcript_18274/m.45704 type:complete len:114 (+) Transcript_18274:423-764(+)
MGSSSSTSTLADTLGRVDIETSVPSFPSSQHWKASQSVLLHGIKHPAAVRLSLLSTNCPPRISVPKVESEIFLWSTHAFGKTILIIGCVCGRVGVEVTCIVATIDLYEPRVEW